MEFGPEIKVDGKRPEWLEDHEIVPIRDHYDTEGRWQGTTPVRADRPHWPLICAMRLPANHPHYTTPTPDERAVAPELVYRMKNAILRHVACKPYLFDDDEGPNISVEAELRSIAAALEPVDEDLVEARKIACQNSRWSSGDEAWRNVQEGRSDHFPIVQCAIAALARGRQLQRDSVTGVTLRTREQFEKECG